MLATLDQWAFQFLMFIAGLSPVNIIPTQNSNMWQLKNQWALQHDGSYQMTLQSYQVSEACKKNENLFIIFPHVYLSRQKVFRDDLLISTNDIGEIWSLDSAFRDTVISCKYLIGASNVTYNLESYIKFYATLNQYPQISDKIPFGYRFNSTMYTLAFYIVMGIGALGTIVMALLASKKDAISFTFLCINLGILMLSYNQLLGISFNVRTLQVLNAVGLWGTFLFLAKYYYEKKSLIIYISYLLVSILSIMCSNYRNTLLLLSMLVVLPSIGIFSTIFFKIPMDRKWYNRTEKLIFLILIITLVRDAYYAIFVKSGIFLMPLIVLIATVFLLLKIIKLIELRKKDQLILLENLEDKAKLNFHLETINVEQKMIMHDLKSPLTALNFAKNADSEFVKKIIDRVTEITKRIESSASIQPDWYKVNLCVSQITEVVELKQKQIKFDFALRKSALDNIEVFFSVQLLNDCIMEIVDNSAKHNQKFNNISINIYTENSNTIIISIIDHDSKLDDRVKSRIGQKGVSVTGTGLGIFGIKGKLNKFSGKFDISESEIGVESRIELKCRESKRL